MPHYTTHPCFNCFGEVAGYRVDMDGEPYTFHPSKEETERKAIQYAQLDELVAIRERDQANNSAEAC